MPSPHPQTIANDLTDQLQLLALSAGAHANVEPLKAQFLRDCEQLQKIDVIRASLLKSNYFALLGDRHQSDYWLKNARQNGAREAAVPHEEANYFLMGLISSAYPIFETAFLNRGNGKAISYLHKALSCGWFRKAHWVLDQIDPKEVPKNLVDLTRTGLRIVESLKLSEGRICSLMDEAHAVMREHGLIWLGEIPIFRLSEKEPEICVIYRISSTPDDAAELTWALIDRLVNKNLDTLGVVISFQGTIVKTGELQRATVG